MDFNIKNNYDKIKFEWLGKCRRTTIVYGKYKTYVLRCPICKSETTFFRRKGMLKIKCDKCPYEMITTISGWIHRVVQPYQLDRLVSAFFTRMDDM